MKTAAICLAAIGITLVVVNYFIYYFAATLVPHFSYAASLAFGMAFAFTVSIDTSIYSVGTDARSVVSFRWKMAFTIVLMALMVWQFCQGSMLTKIT